MGRNFPQTSRLRRVQHTRRHGRSWTLFFGCMYLFVVCFCGGISAQTFPFQKPAGPPATPPLPGLQERPVPSPLPQILPPVSPSPAPPPALPSLLRVFVREIRLTGNTVFSATQLATITAPYVNGELTTKDLEALRLDLTRLYIDHGYITSGVIIPDQTVTDGVITLHLIEGRLHDIEVAGQR